MTASADPPDMDPSAEVARGRDVLLRLLEERTEDVRSLGSAAEMRRWLEPHLERWARDPVFAQRCRIRDLRRAHPRLLALEAEERRARAADERSAHFARLKRLRREADDAEKAVAGLSAALEGADGQKRQRLLAKLGTFRARQAGLRGEEARLSGESGPRRALLAVAGELARLRAETGVEREEARLAELQRERGRRSGRTGASFEEVAAAALREHVVPELAAEGEGGKVRVLRGVTLGAARTEIDHLVVRLPAEGEGTVEVLALGEAKRNANDLAHGFRLRQENLAWLTGSAEGWDPAVYRTRAFPSGRFEGEATHTQGGERFRLSSASFRRFRRDGEGGAFLERLYLVTRPGTLWGVDGGAMARISHRVATDERWDPADDAYLAALLAWCRSLAGPVETPDVLRTYAADEARARRILLVSAEGAPAGHETLDGGAEGV